MSQGRGCEGEPPAGILWKANSASSLPPLILCIEGFLQEVEVSVLNVGESLESFLWQEKEPTAISSHSRYKTQQQDKHQRGCDINFLEYFLNIPSSFR